MNKKIKGFRSYKTPYVVVLGDSEVENRTVAINIRGGKQLKNIPLDKFVAACQKMTDEKTLELFDTEEQM